MVSEDLTGKRFGRLTVIKKSSYKMRKDGKRRSMWLCKCDCGNEIEEDSYSLKSGNTKSCGCLRKEVMSQKYLNDLTGKSLAG